MEINEADEEPAGFFFLEEEDMLRVVEKGEGDSLSESDEIAGVGSDEGGEEGGAF